MSQLTKQARQQIKLKELSILDNYPKDAKGYLSLMEARKYGPPKRFWELAVAYDLATYEYYFYAEEVYGEWYWEHCDG